MSQIELGKALRVSNTTVSQWESGVRTPEVPMMERIADYFGVGIDYLLGRTNDRRPPKPKTPDEQLLDMGIFLRGHGATEEDVRLIKNLIESRKLLKQQAERAQKHPNDKI